MNGARLRVPVSAADHVQGPADAAVTLVEYGDFECPNCRQAYPIVKRVQKRMQHRLRFVYRNFPLIRQHPHARDAAMAAEAAALQGRFWEMHGLLYLNQQDLGAASLFGYAASLGLEVDRFARDARSREVGRKIDADIESGLRSGVNGTPTFFLNGIRYDGQWVGSGFLEDVRDAALERSET